MKDNERQKEERRAKKYNNREVRVRKYKWKRNKNKE